MGATSGEFCIASISCSQDGGRRARCCKAKSSGKDSQGEPLATRPPPLPVARASAHHCGTRSPRGVLRPWMCPEQRTVNREECGFSIFSSHQNNNNNNKKIKTQVLSFAGTLLPTERWNQSIPTQLTFRRRERGQR